METCKYGSGAGKRKPTAVKRKGVVYRAYKRKKCRQPLNTFPVLALILMGPNVM